MKGICQAGLSALVLLVAGGQAFAASAVLDLRINGALKGPSLSLKNLSPVKTVAARDVRVTSADPVFQVSGRLVCKEGARTHSAQVKFGKAFLNNGHLVAVTPYGQSQTIDLPADQNAADISIAAKLPVSKQATDAAIDLSFNPARAFEKKFEKAVQGGASAANYLRQTEVFDMALTISLVAWCRAPSEGDKLYPAVDSRELTASILYNGDPAVTDGMTGGTATTLNAPDKPKPPRAKDAPPRAVTPVQ